MNRLAILTATIAFGLSLAAGEADAAKRFGGGKSSGMQRQEMGQASRSNATPPSPTQAPSTASPARSQQNAATAPAQPKRSWMGPVAGLAAGLGLAALASHLGFGQEFASFMLMALITVGVLFALRFVMRKRDLSSTPALATAGTNDLTRAMKTADRQQIESSDGAKTSIGAGGSGRPQDFDAESFARTAKVNFIRLQAANDARDIEDLREYTTPELLAEIKADWLDEGSTQQKVDVISLDAEVANVTEEASRYVVSVRFTGLLREERHADPVQIDEIWHLTKPRVGDSGWIVAGIQQTN